MPVKFDYWYSIFRKLMLILAYVINFMILFDEFTEACSECD